MRRWLIAAGLVVVVLVGALVVAMANLSRMLGTQRGRLAERATREIGRPVELGELTVSIWRGPGLRIAGVRVAEAPEWGGGDLLRADEVWVTARLLPALAGRFEVARVTLSRPVLTVIRDQRGWNLASLGRQRDPARARPESASRDERRHLALLIGLADMSDGEVRYVDRRREPALELVARQVQASASDVTAGRPVRLGLQAALFGAEKANVSVTGSIGPVADPPVPTETPIDLEWTLDDTDAAALAVPLRCSTSRYRASSSSPDRCRRMATCRGRRTGSRVPRRWAHPPPRSGSARRSRRRPTFRSRRRSTWNAMARCSPSVAHRLRSAMRRSM